MFGGMNVRETVYRLMKEVMSNMLGREYNMNGLKGKKKTYASRYKASCTVSLFDIL